MFSNETYHALNIMLFLSCNHGKKCIPAASIARFAGIGTAETERLTAKLAELGLINRSAECPDSFELARISTDIRLSDIIIPLESDLFSTAKMLSGILGAGQSELLYKKFRPIQEVIETKLKRCRLSDWVSMNKGILYQM